VHESIISVLPPPHLHFPHDYNTIARPLRNIQRHPPDTSCVCYTQKENTKAWTRCAVCDTTPIRVVASQAAPEGESA